MGWVEGTRWKGVLGSFCCRGGGAFWGARGSESGEEVDEAALGMGFAGTARVGVGTRVALDSDGEMVLMALGMANSFSSESELEEDKESECLDTVSFGGGWKGSVDLALVVLGFGASLSDSLLEEEDESSLSDEELLEDED